MGRKRRVIVIFVCCLCFITIFASCKVNRANYDYLQSVDEWNREIRPEMQSIKDFLNQFPNDLVKLDSIYYTVEATHFTYDSIHEEPIINYVYIEKTNNIGNNWQIFRSEIFRSETYKNQPNSDTVLWVLEFPAEGWHNYIRMRSTHYVDFYGVKDFESYIIRWKNRANNMKNNWDISEYTDTIVSTLPEEIIKINYPQFCGVYISLKTNKMFLSKHQSNKWMNKIYYAIKYE